MNKPPTWFYVVAVAATLWGIMGCYAYIMQVNMGPDELAALSEPQRDLWLMIPTWVKGAYAIAVWSCLAGGIALLLRSRFAHSAYLISLIAIVVQFGWTFLASPMLSTMGPSSAAFPLFITVTGAVLLWFAGKAASRGWLR